MILEICFWRPGTDFRADFAAGLSGAAGASKSGDGGRFPLVFVRAKSGPGLPRNVPLNEPPRLVIVNRRFMRFGYHMPKNKIK